MIVAHLRLAFASSLSTVLHRHSSAFCFVWNKIYPGCVSIFDIRKYRTMYDKERNLSMKKWIVPAFGIMIGVVAIAAIACEPAPPAAAPAPTEGQPPASTPIASIEPTQPPVTSQPPISILDTIDPEQCSFIHNINACFSDEGPPVDLPMGSYTQVFFLARDDAVERSGVKLETLVIKSVEAVEWPNTSLGNPEPGMSYAQVIVPGFKLVLELRRTGSTYTYHTSTDRVVFISAAVSILDTIDPEQCSFMHNINACFSDGEPPADLPMGSYLEVFHQARFDVVERFGLNLEAIVIKNVEAVEWDDTSLGNPEPGMLYAEVIVPGFMLVLESRETGATYTYHTSIDSIVFIESAEGVVLDLPDSPVQNDEPVAITSDTAQIVELVLTWALIEGRIPDFGLLDDQQNIILSLENIDAELVPQLPGINFILLSPDEIQRRADEDGDFLRLSFQHLSVSDSRAEVVIENSWAVGKDSRVGYLSGGGCTLEFHKEGGAWVLGDSMACWIA